jgi:hypothetical protein
LNGDEKLAFIRAKAAANRLAAAQRLVVWSAHAVGELVADRLVRSDVEAALAEAVIVENYPTVGRPLPDCPVLGDLRDGRPIHAVVAIDTEQDQIIVVTVYRPDAEEWEDDWRTRRK